MKMTLIMLLFTATCFSQNTRTIVNVIQVEEVISLANLVGEYTIVPTEGTRVVVETTINTNFPEHINLALAKRWEVSFSQDELTRTTEILFSLPKAIPTYKGITLEEKISHIIYLPKGVREIKRV